MNTLIAAIQFLTIIRLRSGKFNERQIGRSSIFFPLVGLGLGLILISISATTEKAGLNSLASNTIIVLALIILTRGLHLDGLADTFDSFLSGKDKKGMLDILHDSRLGAMGTIGIICVLMLKVSLLGTLDPQIKNNALIVSCLLSRWAMVFSIFFFNYAREDGKAGIFFKNIDLKIFVSAALFSITAALLCLQQKGLICFIVVSIVALIIGNWSKRKIDGITGDVIGAIAEITECSVLFCLAALKTFI